MNVTGNQKFVCAGFNPSPQGCVPYRIVPDGFSAVVTSYGRCIGVWRPGLYWAPPWVQIDYLIPWRHMVFDSLVKECPTQDNVFVEIDVALVLRIEKDDASTIKFCYELGPHKLNGLLMAFQSEAIRTMARQKTYSEIYDLMDSSVEGQLDNTKKTMNDRLKDYGVTVTHITITNVTLPRDIAATMEAETTYESLNKYEIVKQKYELLVR
jgi:regulator of protease activity HflC (stomatin/prohibitin superfamily)